MKITITHIDTACVLLDINGYKILTDPTLDAPGQLYHHGFGGISRKTDTPAAVDLSNIDLVLLSHHQHKDNFDKKGRTFTQTVKTVLSTPNAARAIPGIIGLDNWQTYTIQTDKVPGLAITATPAQHRPSWIPEFVSGKVIGFIIEFAGQDKGVIYISGDTVYFSGIEEVARRYKIDTGIFHVGCVEFRYLTGFGHYTMDGKELIRSVKLLQPNKVIPIHTRGWTHFKEKESSLKETLLADEATREKTVFLAPGKEEVI
ncbi:MAG: MBL fold metallo-hydrolase [Candidatus Pseudobacter hemicellulosilyticus]|uniref:MBL fold metallo-hydrolase n=1 Tax=Candidatus Pseudobacter hemicellulosilyticus TaxID=3121375 RepID=A0AAJ6BH26_9BACT|nr:MAG: MBL fold metallo-hydrolase [Pseudobacter sp.]